MKVIYLMADTFRRDHLGAYGNRWIRTPNLDRLAAQSALFENAHIGSFPTVPNRRDTLLGRGDIGLPFNRWKGFERDEVTLPQRLAEKKIPSMWISDTQNNVTHGINMNKGYTAWALNRGQEAYPICWLNGLPCVLLFLYVLLTFPTASRLKVLFLVKIAGAYRGWPSRGR